MSRRLTEGRRLLGREAAAEKGHATFHSAPEELTLLVVSGSSGWWHDLAALQRRCRSAARHGGSSRRGRSCEHGYGGCTDGACTLCVSARKRAERRYADCGKVSSAVASMAALMSGNRIERSHSSVQWPILPTAPLASCP